MWWWYVVVVIIVLVGGVEVVVIVVIIATLLVACRKRFPSSTAEDASNGRNKEDKRYVEKSHLSAAGSH